MESQEFVQANYECLTLRQQKAVADFILVLRLIRALCRSLRNPLSIEELLIVRFIHQQKQQTQKYPVAVPHSGTPPLSIEKLPIARFIQPLYDLLLLCQLSNSFCFPSMNLERWIVLLEKLQSEVLIYNVIISNFNTSIQNRFFCEIIL